MSSPDEEIPGQILGGCAAVLIVGVVCLAALVGLVALIVDLVK